MEPNPDDNPLMVDLLWSDPKGKDGYGPSGRMSSGIYLRLSCTGRSRIEVLD